MIQLNLPFPPVINPCKVRVQVGVPEETLFDDDFREPVGHLVREPEDLIIEAGLNYLFYFEDGFHGEAHPTGLQVGESGYLVASTHELQKQGWDPKQAIHRDRLVEFYVDTPEAMQVDAAIVRITPIGHINGQPQFHKIFFSDQVPAQKNKGGQRGLEWE